MKVFVPDYDWNAKWPSVEASVEAGQYYGDYNEGDEFQMAHLVVESLTTYKIVDGKPVAIGSQPYPDLQPHVIPVKEVE